MSAIAIGKGPANAPTGTEGIDQGFDYAPGASLGTGSIDPALQDFAVKKINALPPETAQALAQDIAPLLKDVLPDTIERIIALVRAGLITAEAAKKLAKLLPGFGAATVAQIEAAGYQS